ncbi:grpE protein homolog 1, mitochondrial-like isoform X2 [Coffea eugenioides]|uniref:grpE protein homolog 1, mitochondrial-like isoform X2 n=1 Tax=Coffea eugenioides TaxID=49369 RepID=UPI000F611233|nr:grpE protein homolog 1, mitochondrial-like isoform X2 [Coffea eugenioides]
MLVSRIAARSSRTMVTQCRNSLLPLARQEQPFIPILSSQYHSLVEPRNKVVSGQVALLHRSFLNGSPFQLFGFSSSASPQHNEKDTAQPGAENGSDAAAAGTSTETEVHDKTEASASTDSQVKDEKDVSDSDSDSEGDLSRDDLVKLVAEKEEQLKIKHEELQKLQDKALRTYADMQNSMDRTKRDAENLKKFAVQDFAKNLLDVADNLSRASLAVKDNFLKIDASKDAVGAVPLLKTLLQGVEMTEKQLAEVFKKYGLQKYDPVDEEFDPHRHNAVFQVPDPSKPPNTVAVVLKAGYKLHDRVIRPAEVGVTRAVENDAEQSSET